MNKLYKIKEKDLNKALEQLDKFQTKMELFVKKYPRFSYATNITKELDEWLILLNIKTKDEQSSTKTF